MTGAAGQSRTGGVSLPATDTGCRCVRCEYNLTGLTSNVCPECGWQIDWRLAALDEEERRIGTPAHRARRWRRIDQTALTVLMMLLAPWRFARQIRIDESVGPSLVLAILSFLGLAVTVWPVRFVDVVLYVAAVTAVTLCQSLCFATLYRIRSFRAPRWKQRFRVWLLISMYSTCFVGLWGVVGDPPVVGGITSTNFHWPLRTSTPWFSGPKIGVTIIFYWWWAILAVALLIRTRPRWLAAFGIPLVFALSWIGMYAAVLAGSLLHIW